jgi:Ran GTPase-activating protein (RanGAP) involved in mRNA processing and transport
LEELNLQSNHIHDEGALALAAALPSSRLQVLSLAHNPITNEGVSKLLDALERSSLRVLDLDGIALNQANRDRLRRLMEEKCALCGCCRG